MQLSEQTNELFKALAKFQGDCPTVTKDASVSVRTRNGGSYTFDYATLTNILETTKETLADNGLAVLQFTESQGVSTMITHESGQWLITNPLLLQADPRTDKDGNELPPTPQDVGSTLTYAKRYQLAGVLKVDAMEDDDANVASGNTAEKKSKSPSKAKKEKNSPKEEKKSESKPKKQESKGDLDKATSPQEAIDIIRATEENPDQVRNQLLQWYTAKQKKDAEFKEKYHSEMMQRMQSPNLELKDD